MSFLKDNWFKLVSVALMFIIAIGISILNSSIEQNKNQKKSSAIMEDQNRQVTQKIESISAPVDSNWYSPSKVYSDTVVCTLKLSATTVLNDRKLSLSSNLDEKPTVLTFIDIDSLHPSIIGNLGYKAPLTKIDNGNFVYLIEKTDFGNMNIFTLFRDKNVMTLSKQYDNFGTPFGMLMIGDCLSSSPL